VRRTRYNRLTPKLAALAFCKICAEGVGVEDCQGDQALDGFACPFYSYRLGKGRPSVKLIRKVCLHCMGGSASFVRDCTTSECMLYQYRLGTNPKRKGMGGNIEGGEILSLNRENLSCSQRKEIRQ